MKKKLSIGFDNWLYSVSKINQLQNLSKSLTISFKPLKKNPIDLIWKTKPAKPTSFINPHPIKYSGLNSKEKIIGVIMLERIISESLGVDQDMVKDESNFVNDLCADSLNIVELVMAIEEEFDMEIPDEDSELLHTVGELRQYIEDNS